MSTADLFPPILPAMKRW